MPRFDLLFLLGLVLPVLTVPAPARPKHSQTHFTLDGGSINDGPQRQAPRLSRRVYNGPTGGEPTPEDLERIQQVEDLALLYDPPDAYGRYEFCCYFILDYHSITPEFHQRCLQYARDPAATTEDLQSILMDPPDQLQRHLQPHPVPPHPRKGLTPEELARVAEARRRYMELRRFERQIQEELAEQRRLIELREAQRLEFDKLPDFQKKRYQSCLDLVHVDGTLKSGERHQVCIKYATNEASTDQDILQAIARARETQEAGKNRTEGDGQNNSVATHLGRLSHAVGDSIKQVVLSWLRPLNGALRSSRVKKPTAPSQTSTLVVPPGGFAIPAKMVP